VANDSATVSWNANTESDLAGYLLSAGLFPGVYTFSVSLTFQTQYTVQESQLNSDGLWYFALQSRDTSSNVSAFTTSVSKRITRTQSKLRLRR
jgi:hypothetical protein